MSNDIHDLYQELILDHNRSPRNFRVIEDADVQREGFNPLCGDHYTVYLKLDGDVVADVSFHGSGCAISKASASMMTTMVKGKTRDEIRKLFERFHAVVTGTERAGGSSEELGKLAVFAGISEYPSRVKCATLPWHTLHEALFGPPPDIESSGATTVTAE
ncbi:MAG: SUF system NifU family Fe-S cluster assembly protein [Bacteroidota bacterium]|nr:SUF system NifU family Fe-S cluster assembly protein [Bacteroidota bacterium]